MVQFYEKSDIDKVILLLSRSLPYYLKSWHTIGPDKGIFGNTAPASFNMSRVRTSSPVIEYVIRPHINILCILSSYLFKDVFSQIKSGVSQKEAIDYINEGLLWMCETHVKGSLDVESFLNRKRWGENWRSGQWAALMGLCAYLTGDFLKTEIVNKIKTIIAFEADRFIDVLPPSGYVYDTKLEENAQDTMVMAWAINLLPDHPHAKQWERSLNIWAINIASSPRDKADHSEHLGNSIAYWTLTQNLFPDMTAENHGFFNPEILSYGTWIVLSMAAYRFFNNNIPSSFQLKTHQETFDNLLRFCLPNGMTYSPCCNDLPFFIPHPFALAWGLWNNDPRAQCMTSYLLDWMDMKLQPLTDSDIPWVLGFKPQYEGWELFFQSQVGFELAMLSIIPFPKEQRLYSIGQIEGAIDTNLIYPYIQLCYRRNTRTTRSVAWKALSKHPTIGFNIHSYPELLTPYEASLLGIPKIDLRVKSWEVAFHYDFIKKNGFETYGRINYLNMENKIVMHRDFRVITWGDDGIVVFDRIFADTDIKFFEQYLSPVYIVNDVWTNKRICLKSGSLKEVICSKKVYKRFFSCPSFWASIEESVIFQFIWGRNKGLTYIPGNRPNAPSYWNNCRLDILAVQSDEKHYKKGDVAYEIGFFIGSGKGPRLFKSAGNCQEFFKGLFVMDGKNTVGLD